jgi:hypothetical protein
MDLSQLPTFWYGLITVLVVITAVIIGFIAVVCQGRPVKAFGIEIGERPKDQKQRQRPRSETPPDQKVADLPQTRLPEVLPSVKSVAGNDLGNGVKMGGQYHKYDIPPQDLELVSSDWMRWGDGGWVKSGWFYTPPDSDLSHAVAFFKIHCHDNGNGYVHVLSASSRWHEIWLQTNTGSSERHTFKYSIPKDIKSEPTKVDNLMAHWTFTWKKPSSP